MLRSVPLVASALLLALAPACSSAETGGSASSTSSSSGSVGSGGGASVASSSGAGGAGGGTGIGGDRPVKLVVPKSYDGKTPVPLVILLHGYSATGAIQEAYFKLTAEAEARGFLYAIPDGTKDAMGNRFWNASDACCNFGEVDVDDSGYLAGVIDEIEKAYAVDPKRIFLVGHSNGGFMSFRMACDHAGTIAAIASLAGAMPADVTKCKPSEPVGVLQIHGTVDATIEYEGGAIFGNAYPSAEKSVTDWVELNGCGAMPESLVGALDLEKKLAGSETSIAKYTGCKAGGAAELWTIEGGGHLPSLTADFAPKVLDFLLAHPKP